MCTIVCLLFTDNDVKIERASPNLDAQTGWGRTSTIFKHILQGKTEFNIP
jgi:hypothetical protein